MRRIIACVLSVIFIIGMVPAAFASSSFTVTATPDKGKVSVGETITVLIALSGTEPSTSGSVDVSVGDDLEVVSGEMLGNGGIKSFDISTNKGVVASLTGSVSFDGDFAKITVKVLEDAPQIMTVTVKLNPSGAEQTIEVTLNEETPEGAPSCTASLNLNDNVDIKVYVSGVTSSMITGGYYVEYSTDGGVTYSDGFFDEEHLVKDDKYGFTVASFSANQLTKEVLFRVCDGTGKEITDLTYSVKEYCDYQLENASDEGLKTLCGALMAYGFFAQLRFPDSASELINSADYFSSIASALSVTSDDLSGFASSASCVAPVTKAGASLSLESRTKLNFYLTGVDSASGLTLLVGGNIWSDYKVDSVSTMNGDLKCCIRVNGLNTVDLTKQIVLICGSTFINYSPMSYVKYAIANNTAESNVCKALYRYVMAAKAYFNVA
ncbi:MAG: hypothetical protein IJM71_04630 [Clostridia bacterium]|nr:hypothetical protein [Clostridia bacterium]